MCIVNINPIQIIMEDKKNQAKDNDNRDKFCKSTTYLESRRSRITKSFIKTNSSTVLSNNSEQSVYEVFDNSGQELIKFNKNQTNGFYKITEFDKEDEDDSEDSLESNKESFSPKKIITFSIYLNKAKIGNSNMPMIIKETFEADSNEFLHVLLVLFLQMLNKKLKDYGYKFDVPSDSTSIDEKYYMVKPMKKSGKPDIDLPGFDLKTRLKDFCVSSFSVVFDYSRLNKYPVNTIDDMKDRSSSMTQKVQVNSLKVFRESTHFANTLTEKKEQEINNKPKITNETIKQFKSDKICCEHCLIF
jgi:hypothetical protein